MNYENVASKMWIIVWNDRAKNDFAAFSSQRMKVRHVKRLICFIFDLVKISICLDLSVSHHYYFFCIYMFVYRFPYPVNDHRNHLLLLTDAYYCTSCMESLYKNVVILWNGIFRLKLSIASKLYCVFFFINSIPILLCIASIFVVCMNEF